MATANAPTGTGKNKLDVGASGPAEGHGRAGGGGIELDGHNVIGLREGIDRLEVFAGQRLTGEHARGRGRLPVHGDVALTGGVAVQHEERHLAVLWIVCGHDVDDWHVFICGRSRGRARRP